MVGENGAHGGYPHELGENMHTPHRKAMPMLGLATYEVTVLTTEPPCHPVLCACGHCYIGLIEGFQETDTTKVDATLPSNSVVPILLWHLIMGLQAQLQLSYN